ncbi:MAG: hypothetical protein JST00_31705 [Deltaproteobacteria bacterium]|nr:hypothetical protein [Deltaproteobacteria bacterium]
MSLSENTAVRTPTPEIPPPPPSQRRRAKGKKPQRVDREQTLRAKLQSSQNHVDRLLRQNIELANEVEHLRGKILDTNNAIDALRDLGEDLQVVEMCLLSPHTRECHDTNFVSNNVMRLGKRLNDIAESLLDAPRKED